MANTEDYSLYLASWEHLYLLPGGLPAGLPNQLFSRHPWALIVFEHLYCDENGFKGEMNAAEQMHWTNSELFRKLGTPKYDIIKTLDVKSLVCPRLDSVNTSFKEQHGKSVEQATQAETVSVDELFEWRLKLLDRFLAERKLVLYDWPLARWERPIPPALRIAVEEVLQLEAARVPLSKDVNTELTPERKAIFEELQKFEHEPLQKMRTGRLRQDEYLSILKRREMDYREIDMELVDGLDAKLDRILTLRDRFAKRDGWKLVRDFLRAYDLGFDPRELHEIDRGIRDRLAYCFKPVWGEYARTIVRIGRVGVSLLPIVGEAKAAVEMKKPVEELVGLVSESVRFFSGQIRRGKE